MFDIAIQNFISGGIAVYSARAMLDLIVDDFTADGAYRYVHSLGSQSSNEVKIYPNPASGHLYIDALHGLIEELSIVNVMGETIIKKRYINKPSDYIDLKNLSEGIYFAKVKLSSQTFYSTKLIVIK